MSSGNRKWYKPPTGCSVKRLGQGPTVKFTTGSISKILPSCRPSSHVALNLASNRNDASKLALPSASASSKIGVSSHKTRNRPRSVLLYMMSVCPCKKGPPTAMPIRLPVPSLDNACIQTLFDLTNHTVMSANKMVCAPSKVVKCGSPNVAHNPGSGSSCPLETLTPVTGGTRPGSCGVSSPVHLSQQAATCALMERCNASTM
mmetsp:Transcript_38642/g.111570  ORF Transcript_38642/g.111570 Transcript_38642/m.111570 type:complete len:203 (-) Transcript_38642:465-1073(-)